MSNDFGVSNTNEINLKYVCSEFALELAQDVEETKIDNATGKDSRIEFMLQALPKLDEVFDVQYCIGSGTFSSVYLATLKSDGYAPFSERRKFAIKYLLPTSHPKRIEQELKCLQKIGGSENVVNINFCMRSRDSVVFVMPYLQHEKFTSYIMDMGPSETQLYMKNLLIAVRSVHKFDVIHRDVKPANFLYDRVHKKFLLVDMGLAHSVDDISCIMPKLTSVALSNDNKRKRSSERENGPKDVSSPILHINKKIMLSTDRIEDNHSKEDKIPKSPLKQLNSVNKFGVNMKVIPNKVNSSLSNTQRMSMFEFRNKHDLPESGKTKTFPAPPSKKFGVTNAYVTTTNPFIIKTNTKSSINRSTLEAPKKCRSGYKPGRAAEQLIQEDKERRKSLPGPSLDTNMNKMKYDTNVRLKALNKRALNNIKSSIQINNKEASINQCTCFGKSQVCKICCSRKAVVAKREGTPGFRPPEVLLKYTAQTTAVDIWAVGIILLCILSRCYPFFDAPDDLTALAEIITLFGTQKIRNIALLLDRSITASCEEIQERNLRQVCELLRNRECFEPDVYKKESNLNNFPDSIYDLLSRLLDVNPFTRITAADALNHEFFSENLVN